MTVVNDHTSPTRRRWFQFGTVSILAGTLLIALCGGLIRYLFEDRLCLFHFSAGRSILISEERGVWEVNCPFYYSAVSPGRTLDPFWFSMTDRPWEVLPEHFRAFELSDGLVVVQQDIDGKWEDVIVHDFSTGKSFPANAKRTDFSYDLTRATPARVETWRKRYPLFVIESHN